MKTGKGLQRKKEKVSTAPPKPKATVKEKEPKPKKGRSALKNESDKQKAKNRKYREVPLSLCLCGSEATERHHIYTQKDAAYLRTEQLNILPLCNACHKSATGRESEYRERLRLVMPERMEELDHLYRTVGKDNNLRRMVQG